TAECAWECLSDSDCGTGSGLICNDDGACIVAPLSGFAPPPTTNASDDSAACQDIPAATRRAALIALAANPQPDPCNDDIDCPCGAYCNDTICAVDCLAASPPPDLACLAGEE